MNCTGIDKRGSVVNKKDMEMVSVKAGGRRAGTKYIVTSLSRGMDMKKGSDSGAVKR